MNNEETHKDDVEALKLAGKALYGDRWQTDLARDLKLSDPRRIRQWVAGERPIPPGVRRELVALIRIRIMVLQACLKELELKPGAKPPSDK